MNTMTDCIGQTEMALKGIPKKHKVEKIKSDSIRVLEELMHKRQRSVGVAEKIYYEDRTANGLTKCVVDWIKLHDGQAERINTTGRPITTPNGIRWLRSTSTAGSADISATIKGRSVKIEIKIGTDRQSAEQKQYQRDIENAGGIYLIIRHFDEFYMWWHEKGCNL